MNDPRISQLNLAKPLSGNEFIPLTQRSQFTGELATVYTSPSAFKDYILGARADAFCPAGSITAYACPVSANNAPSGWLLCDGRSVRCVEYGKLFSKIGTTYGGDGVDTFKLPDLRGRLITGYCSTSAVDTFADVVGGNWQGGGVLLGSVGGKFQHKLTSAEVPVQAATINIPQVEVKPKVISKPSQPQIYARGPEIGTWTDALNLSVYGDSIPNVLNLRLFYGQSDVMITNGGVWQFVGSTGNNSALETYVSVRPDGNGKVYVQVINRGWGGHQLTVYADVPGRTEDPPPSAVATVSSPSNTNTLFNITQPYMVMNYIIKC